jgi:MFS family permease
MTSTTVARRSQNAAEGGVDRARTPSDGALIPGQLSHRQILEVMTGLLAALFTAMLSTTIVSTALPTIMSDLHGTQRQYTWVITASLLAMTISTPIFGKLSDLFDKKLLVQLSIVVFVAPCRASAWGA